jgi:hypothetical protein
MRAITGSDLANWREGAREFNRGRWWEAHEAWEREWTRLPPDVRRQVQHCIQVTGVLFLVGKGRVRGAASLAARALELWAPRVRGQPTLLIPGARRLLARCVELGPDGIAARSEALLRQGRTLRARVRAG